MLPHLGWSWPSVPWIIMATVTVRHCLTSRSLSRLRSLSAPCLSRSRSLCIYFSNILVCHSHRPPLSAPHSGFKALPCTRFDRREQQERQMEVVAFVYIDGQRCNHTYMSAKNHTYMCASNHAYISANKHNVSVIHHGHGHAHAHGHGHGLSIDA